MKEPITLPFYARLAFVLIAITGLGYLIILGQSFLAPLFLGTLFAILLLPLAHFFEKRCRLPRAAASGASVLVLIISVSSVVFLIVTQLGFLVTEWPHLSLQIDQSFHSLQKWVEATFHYQVSKQVNYLNSMTSKALSASTSVLGSALLSVSSLLLFFIFTLLYTFFVLFYRKRLVDFLIAVFREENSTIVLSVLQKVQYMIKKYIVGLFIEMGVVATISSILFWILGSKFVLLLGLITGIFNVIPYIGIFTALMISGFITFATASPVNALFIMLAVVGVHLLDSNILMPQILGSKVRLNALIIVLGVVVGEMLWGITGMFVAIPVLAILKIIFDHVDSLKPWAILLGDDADSKEETPKLRVKLRRQKK